MPCRVPGYLRLARRLRSRSLAIVMYHGVVATPQPVFSWCQLPVAEFQRQMEFLSEEYNVLPLPEAVERLRSGSALQDCTACLTFDDGFRNVCTTAYPILEKYRLPATVFLVTSLVGTNQPAWPDRLFHAVSTTAQMSVRLSASTRSLATPCDRAAAYRALAAEFKRMENNEKEKQLAEMMQFLGQKEVAPDSPLATMGWDEVEQLSRTGLVHFGSHTHTHPILSRCSPESQREELRRSREVLRERLGKAELFAYPNGTPDDFTAETKELIADLEYRCAVTTISGLNRAGSDLYALRRVNVGADMRLHHFKQRMIGL